MSSVEILPRVRGFRLPRIDGLTPWIVPLVILLVWQLACVSGFVPARVMPAPTDVALAGWKLLRSGELVQNIWVSFWRASVGFAIGGSIGFAFGLANGLSELSSKLTDTTLQMVRNVPHLALIPLVILWFGIDESAKLFLVALGVFFPIYLNTLHGIRTVDPQLIEMGRVYGMSPVSLFTRVVLPTIVPALLTGFALAFARATGEYGSVIFIAGNLPMVSEITPLLIISKLEQYDYAGATAIAVVMLVFSFILLLTINLLQAWTRKRAGKS